MNEPCTLFSLPPKCHILKIFKEKVVYTSIKKALNYVNCKSFNNKQYYYYYLTWNKFNEDEHDLLDWYNNSDGYSE